MQMLDVCLFSEAQYLINSITNNTASSELCDFCTTSVTKRYCKNNMGKQVPHLKLVPLVEPMFQTGQDVLIV